jgi:hypothetical protein
MKTVKLTFTREDCNTILEATRDENINGIMSASDSPMFAMFEWLNKNAKNETYDKAGSITVDVPERIAVAYLGSLLLMDKISPKWNFRRMAFRASGALALFVECSMMDILEKMDTMNEEGNDDAHRWN